VAVCGLAPGRVGSGVHERRRHERGEREPAKPGEGNHRGEEPARGELGAEGGKVGPNGCGDGCPYEPEDPEDEEPGELMPYTREVAELVASMDHVDNHRRP